MKQPETVAILGASPETGPLRNAAFQMLREHGHRPIPINPPSQISSARNVTRNRRRAEADRTVTLYLGEARSNPLIDEIIVAKPRRIIMNPGAENPALAQRAEEAGIEWWKAAPS